MSAIHGFRLREAQACGTSCERIGGPNKPFPLSTLWGARLTRFKNGGRPCARGSWRSCPVADAPRARPPRLPGLCKATRASTVLSRGYLGLARRAGRARTANFLANFAAASTLSQLPNHPGRRDQAQQNLCKRSPRCTPMVRAAAAGTTADGRGSHGRRALAPPPCTKTTNSHPKPPLTQNTHARTLLSTSTHKRKGLQPVRFAEESAIARARWPIRCAPPPPTGPPAGFLRHRRTRRIPGPGN